MYKTGTRLNLRFNINGSLTIAQVWSLSLSQLATLIKTLKTELKKNDDDELSFLNVDAVQTDPKIQLRFDIAKDIYLTKAKEAEDALNFADRKVELQKLFAIKAKRAEEAQDKMSDAELDAAIEKLNKK